MDIAKKLKADVTKDGAHKRAFVKIGGKDVLSFGIRHDKTACLSAIGCTVLRLEES